MSLKDRLTTPASGKYSPRIVHRPRIECVSRRILMFVITILLMTIDIAVAGTQSDLDESHTVPWAFRVELNQDRILSLKNLQSVKPKDISSHSPAWLAAMAAIDSEVAMIVNKLQKSHPRAEISSVTGRKNPGFTLRASDAEARSMAQEAVVKRVEGLGPADEVIENITMNPWE